jgi:hypothetical protein
LAGPPAIQVRLNVRFGELDPWRTTVHDHAHATAVRFAKRRDAEQLPESACHAVIVRKKGSAVKSRNGRERTQKTQNENFFALSVSFCGY